MTSIYTIVKNTWIKLGYDHKQTWVCYKHATDKEWDKVIDKLRNNSEQLNQICESPVTQRIIPVIHYDNIKEELVKYLEYCRSKQIRAEEQFEEFVNRNGGYSFIKFDCCTPEDASGIDYILKNDNTGTIKNIQVKYSDKFPNSQLDKYIRNVDYIYIANPNNHPALMEIKEYADWRANDY